MQKYLESTCFKIFVARSVNILMKVIQTWEFLWYLTYNIHELIFIRLWLIITRSDLAKIYIKPTSNPVKVSRAIKKLLVLVHILLGLVKAYYDISKLCSNSTKLVQSWNLWKLLRFLLKVVERIRELVKIVNRLPTILLNLIHTRKDHTPLTNRKNLSEITVKILYFSQTESAKERYQYFFALSELCPRCVILDNTIILQLWPRKSYQIIAHKARRHCL